jgi:hypothetical protein
MGMVWVWCMRLNIKNRSKLIIVVEGGGPISAVLLSCGAVFHGVPYRPASEA